MKIRVIFTFLIVIFSGAVFAAINSNAVWQMPKNAITEILQCRSHGASLETCAVNTMRKYGASKEAIAFTKMLQEHGFAAAFRDTGKVDVVKTVEIGADHSQGFYLVNGAPKIINIDDWNIVGKLHKNIWFGNHDFPEVRIAPDGTQIFIFNYMLKKCNACNILGCIQVAFKFDHDGKFLTAYRV